jgi:mannose-6-phosphate isomerase-like protein (cupin superfamily)
MPRIIGKAETVVEIDGLKIDELAGNVATNEDTISIAHVTVSSPTSEPWLTLDYDEWLCVTKGKMVLHIQQNKEIDTFETLEVNAGETCFVAKGERFKPVFPIAPTEYIPVCSPAFRPDRCHREEGTEASDVTLKLLKLHKIDANGITTTNGSSSIMDTGSREAEPDVLYHMCQETMWQEAVDAKKAYYPHTFEADGFFTHATAVPQRLIDTANHFYTESQGNWICLQLSRQTLTNVGIITKDEEGLPVGDAPVPNQIKENKWVCPHIYGGIPTTIEGVLVNTFPIERNVEGTFLKITGVTE